MKAEQRKELETNTLADKMGRVVQRVQTSQRRTFMIYAVVVFAIAAAAWFGWRYVKENRTQSSRQWLALYDGGGSLVLELAQSEKDSEAGKAARLQIAYVSYWEFGVKRLGVDPKAMVHVKEAVKIYGDLVDDCKDDPVFGPQAMLGRAVAQETLAVEDRKHLAQAEQFYEQLAKHEKFKESAEAKFAQERLKILTDPVKRAQLADTYATLQGPDLLDIQGPLQMFNPHKDAPDFFPKAKAKP